MLDKFLSKINGSSSSNTSIRQKVEDYNSKVIEEQKKVIPPPNINWDDVQLPERYIDNRFNGFQNLSKGFSPKFKKMGKDPFKFPRPTIYNAPQRNYDNNFQQPNYQKQPTQQFQRREYIDDGSYFCSYAVGGNTLVCYKNKEKVEFMLEGIYHPDKNNYLAKRANYFLNDLVKKQKVYIEPTENGTYNIFLDPQKENCINTILINEGYHNSQPYDAESKDKKTSFNKYKSSSEKNSLENTEEKNIETGKIEPQEIKEKKNYAYGLFATDHNTFEALFNKNKMTLKIDNIDNISKEHKKLCKSMIYDFVSKKSIILKFLKEENGIHYVEVYNKEGECLNHLIAEKNFPLIQEEKTEPTDKKQTAEDKIAVSPSNDNEQCSENDWDWVKENNGAEVDVPDITSLPSMFKNPIVSKPDSPFKKKNQSVVPDNKLEEPIIQNTTQVEVFGEEVDVPDITSLPSMFKNPIVSKADSPFKKKNQPVVPDIIPEQPTVQNNKQHVESFEGEINMPDITKLNGMFKNHIVSNPNSPFRKKISDNNAEVVDSQSSIIENKPEDNQIIVKKKLSFGKR